MAEKKDEAEPQTKEQKKDRWKDVRHMAWLPMIAGCLFPFLVVFTESQDLMGLSMPFYTFLGAVVGVYVGFSTFDKKWSK